MDVKRNVRNSVVGLVLKLRGHANGRISTESDGEAGDACGAKPRGVEKRDI